MIKMAVKDYLNEELLEGVKRPSKRDITDDDWMYLHEAVSFTYEKINKMKESEAAKYFNLKKILNVLKLIQNKKLGRSSQSFYLSGMLHGLILKVIFGGYFINTHFKS